MAAGAIKAGRAYVELALKNTISKGLGRAQASLNKFGNSLGALGSKLLAVGGMMAAPLAMAVQAASKMEETMNKFNVVFGESATIVKQWGDEFAAQVGRSKQQIAEFMSSAADLLIPIGFTPGAATELSKNLTGLAVDLASFNNMADADVMRDLQAALTGSGEVMKKYGVILDEAATKAELLKMGIDPKTATNAQKVQARYNIIMAGTTAAQGDAIRSSGSFANQMKALKATFADAAAEVGGALLPMITPLVTKMVEAVRTAGAWIEHNRALVVLLAKITVGVLATGAALVTLGIAIKGVAFAVGLLNGVLGILGAILSFITSPLGIVIASVALAGYAFVQFTSAGQQMAQESHGYFNDLASTAKTTFDGIKDSLLAGDWKLAARIAWIGMKSSWTSGIRPLKEAWIGFKFTFLNIAGVMWDGIRKGWGRLSGFIQKSWLKMKGWFTDTDTTGQQAAIDAAQAAAEQKMDKERRAEIEANNAEAGAALQAIDKEERDARAELAAVRQKAAEKRREAEAAAAGPEVPELEMGNVEMPQMAEFKAKLNETAGALSSAAAMRMGRDVSAQMDNAVEEQNADANKRTAAAIESVEKMLSDGTMALFI